MDHVILNHGQLTWTTPELAPPLLTTTPHQREEVSALDRFNEHRCPTRHFIKEQMVVAQLRLPSFTYRLATPEERECFSLALVCGHFAEIPSC
ncbi:uncharacterized protein TNCV_310921 [Trichonephila clavipes]|nr:uncharacterized protein TNCV_310921 [Trichonephila clavipes]